MKNENLIQIILEALYRIPDYLSIQKNILEPLNIKTDTAIEIFGTYEAYSQEQKRTALSQREVQYLKEKNIRLKNLNIIVGMISFILGILLSSPIKNILRQ